MKVDGQGHTLLVMDDEEMIRELAALMLIRLGFEVKTAADGEETIALYEESLQAGAPYSAVIMDLTVPRGMGGREAAKRILEMDPKARLVVSSGYLGNSTIVDYEKNGFAAAIAKPYKTAEIETTLYGILRKN